eukprot:CAMPEP_0174257776 /NCGR_PEP_ID=MMETSP0439-20130205/6893_1 /TAXON_ID=0 /ORGANISM="Stereomyxa ramosa, Strain Chinc5" /LENGTH=586 /DNA_ID=CAMNT_0015341027 /DNA_START=94 /DNA_END=1854 /DNA_ORIENTATION=-
METKEKGEWCYGEKESLSTNTGAFMNFTNNSISSRGEVFENFSGRRDRETGHFSGSLPTCTPRGHYDWDLSGSDDSDDSDTLENSQHTGFLHKHPTHHNETAKNNQTIDKNKSRAHKSCNSFNDHTDDNNNNNTTVNTKNDCGEDSDNKKDEESNKNKNSKKKFTDEEKTKNSNYHDNNQNKSKEGGDNPKKGSKKNGKEEPGPKDKTNEAYRVTSTKKRIVLPPKRVRSSEYEDIADSLRKDQKLFTRLGENKTSKSMTFSGGIGVLYSFHTSKHYHEYETLSLLNTKLQADLNDCIFQKNIAKKKVKRALKELIGQNYSMKRKLEMLKSTKKPKKIKRKNSRKNTKSPRLTPIQVQKTPPVSPPKCVAQHKVEPGSLELLEKSLQNALATVEEMKTRVKEKEVGFNNLKKDYETKFTAFEEEKKNLILTSKLEMINYESTTLPQHIKCFFPNPSEKILLNVGGTTFCTTKKTIKRIYTTLVAESTQYTEQEQQTTTENNYFFLDSDGTPFRHVLNYLRDQANFVVPSDFDLRNEVAQQAQHFQLHDLTQLLHSDPAVLHIPTDNLPTNSRATSFTFPARVLRST